MFRFKWPVKLSPPFIWAKNKLKGIYGVLSSIKLKKFSTKTMVFLCVLLLVMGANGVFWVYRATHDTPEQDEQISSPQEWEVDLNEEYLSEEELRKDYAVETTQEPEATQEESPVITSNENVDKETKAQDSTSSPLPTENKNQADKQEEPITAVSAEPNLSTMALPTMGKVITEYAVDKLVYSKTLEQWGCHYGIDISADLGAQVKAAMDGTVVEIRKADPKLGVVVVIDHGGGIHTLYGNLENADLIQKGNYIKKGQVIGAVGKTAPYECEDPSHLHFEVLKYGENIDPQDYLPKIS